MTLCQVYLLLACANDLLDFVKVKRTIEEAAVVHRRKHGTPLVLCFDNINVLRNETLAELVHWAKTQADRHCLRVVFVTSEGGTESFIRGTCTAVLLLFLSFRGCFVRQMSPSTQPLLYRCPR